MSVFIDVVSQFNDAGIDRARKELDKLASTTASTSQKLMKGAAVAGAGILAGATAIGVGLYEIGSQFDEAFDGIRISTGATGPALEGLQNDMKAVAGAVPASFGEAGKAIAELNRRLGLTGAPLQTLSSQMLELSRMTKTDLSSNIEAVSKVMQNFGIDAASQSGKLDLLFRASQASGVSVQDLASSMSGAGVVLREVGLGFDQSAAFLATLAKAGVDAGDVMPALSKALAVAAKNGKDAAAVFSETFNAIKTAPDDIAAAGIALEVFGAKAGPRLAAMIREGKLSFEEMQAAIANGGDTIRGASADTQDFGEKLTLLKNRVLLAIEPIATRVFDKIGEAMDALGPKVEELTIFFSENEDAARALGIVVGGLCVAAFAAFTVSLFTAGGALAFLLSPVAAVIAAIVAIVATLYFVWANWDQIWTWIVEHPALAAIATIVFAPAATMIALVGVLHYLYENWQTIWNAIKDITGRIVGRFQSDFNAIKGGIDGVVGFFQTAKDIIGTVFSGISNAITAPFEAAFNGIKNLWNNTIGGFSVTVPDWVKYTGVGAAIAGKSFSIPRFADGGIFNTGMGGGSGLAVLHDNEMILNPQQQKALFSGGGLGDGPQINVVINTVAGDPDAIERVVIDAIARANRRGATVLVP